MICTITLMYAYHHTYISCFPEQYICLFSLDLMYLIYKGLGRTFSFPVFQLLVSNRYSWKYRVKEEKIMELLTTLVFCISWHRTGEEIIVKQSTPRRPLLTSIFQFLKTNK